MSLRYLLRLYLIPTQGSSLTPFLRYMLAGGKGNDEMIRRFISILTVVRVTLLRAGFDLDRLIAVVLGS